MSRDYHNALSCAITEEEKTRLAEATPLRISRSTALQEIEPNESDRIRRMISELEPGKAG
jgi:hypothetical protein